MNKSIENCPQCCFPPQPKVMGENTWKLECEHPGNSYIAYGNSMRQVIEHWNIYVNFRKKQDLNV